MEFLQNYSVGIVASVIFTLVLYAILVYCGLFYSFKIETFQSPVGRLRIAYLFGVGPYQNCGPLFGRVARLAPDQRCIGIYYDNPKKTPGTHLRYIVGSILSEDGSKVDEATSQQLQADGFKVAEFPAIDVAVGTTFPHPWLVSMFLAMWRVYPKLGKYVEEKKLHARPAIEIYDGPKIHFYMPLSKHDHFFVPEAQEWR